jgi:hypothetical protein
MLGTTDFSEVYSLLVALALTVLAPGGKAAAAVVLEAAAVVLVAAAVVLAGAGVDAALEAAVGLASPQAASRLIRITPVNNAIARLYIHLPGFTKNYQLLLNFIKLCIILLLVYTNMINL